MIGHTEALAQQDDNAMDIDEEIISVEILESLGVNTGDGTLLHSFFSLFFFFFFSSSNRIFFKINFAPFLSFFLSPFLSQVKKLRDASIYSLQQLRSTTSKQLLSIKGFSDAKVTKILDAAKKKLPFAEFNSASDILIRQSAAIPISTGSSDLDELLGGGIETGYLTEIYGEAGAGKTQLLFTLAINAMTSEDPGRVAWIDTEGAFSAQRLSEIAASKGFEDPSECLENVAVFKAPTHELQMQAPSCVGALIDGSDAPYKLIVVDSIIATFRAEFNGRGELSGRQQLLGQHLDEWKKIANNLNIAVVYTNQICADPGNMFVPNAYKPVGGNILAHASHTRMEIKGAGKKDGKRVAKLIKSAKRQNGNCDIGLTSSGVSNFV